MVGATVGPAEHQAVVLAADAHHQTVRFVHLENNNACTHVTQDPPGVNFIAHAVADWCRFNGTDTVFIDPGSPWQNAWIESFNGRLRDDYLNGQLFDTVLESRILLQLSGSPQHSQAWRFFAESLGRSVPQGQGGALFRRRRLLWGPRQRCLPVQTLPTGLIGARMTRTYGGWRCRR